MTVSEALNRLQKSEFRSRFHLSKKELAYIDEKGMETIEAHARDFVHKRLAPSYIENDGRQTPMRGHPVFVAQHATACCCRGCFEKWYRVKKGTALSREQEEGVVKILMAWIQKEYNAYKNKENNREKV